MARLYGGDPSVPPLVALCRYVEPGRKLPYEKSALMVETQIQVNARTRRKRELTDKQTAKTRLILFVNEPELVFALRKSTPIRSLGIRDPSLDQFRGTRLFSSMQSRHDDTGGYAFEGNSLKL